MTSYSASLSPEPGNHWKITIVRYVSHDQVTPEETLRFKGLSSLIRGIARRRAEAKLVAAGYRLTSGWSNGHRIMLAKEDS